MTVVAVALRRAGFAAWAPGNRLARATPATIVAAARTSCATGRSRKALCPPWRRSGAGEGVTVAVPSALFYELVDEGRRPEGARHGKFARPEGRLGNDRCSPGLEAAAHHRQRSLGRNGVGAEDGYGPPAAAGPRP